MKAVIKLKIDKADLEQFSFAFIVPLDGNRVTKLRKMDFVCFTVWHRTEVKNR